MNKLVSALACSERGWHVIPLLPSEKIPAIAWKQYQQIAPTSAELQEWFADGDLNVGVITGAVSGLVVVDADSEQAVKTVESLIATDTLRVKTGKGQHFYFRYPDGHDVRNRAGILPRVDVRANGGYVVAPPSVHPSGSQYRWLNMGAPVADIPHDLLQFIEGAHPKSEAVRTPTGILEGSRNQHLTAVAGALVHLNTTVGGLAEDLVQVNAQRCTPPLDNEEVTAIAKSIFARERSDRPIIEAVRLSEFVPEQIDWLWPGFLASGHMTLIDGHPGEGKSLLAIDLIARLTSGREWPDGCENLGPRDVVLVKPEDHIGSVVIPRLDAAGADRGRVHLLGMDVDSVRFPEDFERVAEQIRRIRPALVVIDPLTMVIGRGLDANVQGDMIAVLHPLRQLAEELGFAQLTTRHTKKNTTGGAMGAGVGSFVGNGIARAVFLLGRHPTEPGVRVLAATKNNLSQLPRSRMLAYVEKGGQPVVDWRGTVPFTADDLATMKKGPTPRDTLESFLRDLLTRDEDGIPVAEATAICEAAGYSKRTIERVRTSPPFETFDGTIDGRTVRMLRLL